MSNQIKEYETMLKIDDTHNGISKPKPLNTIKTIVTNNVSYYLSQSTLASIIKQYPKLLPIYKTSKQLTKSINQIIIRQLGKVPNKLNLTNLKYLLIAKTKRTEISIKLKNLKQ